MSVPRIFLVGFMGAGKSEVGRALAALAGLAFADTDAMVEQAGGIPIEEIFRVHGEGAFREAEWRALLTPEQYAVMRGHGTERPGSCALLHEKRPGTFVCAGCGEPLFEGKLKFESGTGWPSFNEPIPGSTETTSGRSERK